jgi:hypothetical protein
MDAEKVHYAVAKAKANVIKDIIDTMDEVHFGISTLIACREVKKQGYPCLDGCGHKFSVSLF